MNEPILRCSKLTKRFGGLVALESFDIALFAGTIVGVIGPNGSGKTTLFNLLTGILRPTSGTISVSGKQIRNVSPQKAYSLGMARTFQRSRLNLSLSIFENLMLGDQRSLSCGMIFNLLKRGQLSAEIEAAKEKAVRLLSVFGPALADSIGRPAGSLSLIDRRRVEICRALIGTPRILLLDEPSAGMTHDETTKLMDDIISLKDRINDLAIVIVEHEMSVMERLTTNCVALNFGRKIAEGPYAQVSAHAEVQRAYLGVA